RPLNITVSVQALSFLTAKALIPLLDLDGDPPIGCIGGNETCSPVRIFSISSLIEPPGACKVAAAEPGAGEKPPSSVEVDNCCGAILSIITDGAVLFVTTTFHAGFEGSLNST